MRNSRTLVLVEKRRVRDFFWVDFFLIYCLTIYKRENETPYVKCCPGWCGWVDWSIVPQRESCGLISSQGTYLGCRFLPVGDMDEAVAFPSPLSNVFLLHWCFPHSFHPFPSLQSQLKIKINKLKC